MKVINISLDRNEVKRSISFTYKNVNAFLQKYNFLIY